MKKINLFLWGIVSTCITFFYRTEIYGASYITTAVILGDARDNCDGYEDSKVEGSVQLANKYYNNNPMNTLCDSNEIFLGCNTGTGTGGDLHTYLVSEENMETMAQKCSMGSGICQTGCPLPGSKQTKSDPTYMRSIVYIVLCSDKNPATDDYLGAKYLINWYAIPNDGTAFININRRSNTCAINAGEECDDDTGECEYADKCWYTE